MIGIPISFLFFLFLFLNCLISFLLFFSLLTPRVERESGRERERERYSSVVMMGAMMAHMTHMRVGAVVWVLTTHINGRQEAVVHVGRQ